MNFKIKFSLLVILLFNVVAFAQQKRVLTGKVTSASDNMGVPGANVRVLNGGGGTSTDFDGSFSISVTEGDKLQITYLGFATQTVVIADQKTLEIVLSENDNILEQVVIVGYGTQKRSDVTGSVSKVSNKDLDQIPTSRVDDALSGQVSGVTIQSTNPSAGSAPTIKVRGQGSISFDSNPLVVVDGIAVGNDGSYLGSIDMNTVESIEILKDASSSSIYGSRGANGVVMITTKKGKEGPLRISYNTYTGYKFVPETGLFTTPEAWTQKVSDQNGGVIPNELKQIQKMGTYTNWEKEIFDGGYITDHSLSVMGGSENTKFRTSLSYTNDEGVVLTDNFKKLNLSLNLDTKRGKSEFGVMLNPSMTEQRVLGNSLINVIRQQPWLPIYIDENSLHYVDKLTFPNVKVGDYAEENFFINYDLVNDTTLPSTSSVPLNPAGTHLKVTGDGNPYASLVERNFKNYETKIFGNAYFKFNFTDKLSFKQSAGGDYSMAKSINRTGVLATKNYAGDASTAYSSTNRTHSVIESVLNYNNDFGKHNVTAVAGFAREDWKIESLGINGAGYANDYVETIANANVFAGGANMNQREEALISYFGRVNYGYDNRYLLAVSFRTDGSSKFGDDTKFGSFPAASIGWKVSNEKFWPQNNIVTDLKIRGSYGVTGSNSGIPEYAHLGLVTPSSSSISGTSTGANLGNIPNGNLGWEKLEEINPGIDVSFLGSALTLSFDYYVRTSEDLLLNLPVPAVTGFNTALQNKGKVENRGYELELRSRNWRTENFTWSSSFLLSQNKNTLLDFAGSDGLISVVDSKRAAEWQALEGSPISSYYGYVVDKEIDNSQIKNPNYPINVQSQDIYVKDLNGDGVITTADRTVLGNPYPDFTWSLTNNFRYKNVDFSFMFQGSHGAEVRNIDSQYLNNEFNSNADYNSSFPVADRPYVKERIFTSDDIQDASYIALRNINLGYTISSSLTKKLQLSRLRVYAAAQNLLYFMADDYKGFNPEGIMPTQPAAGTNQPSAVGSVPTTPLTYGYQVGPSPIYKTVSVGLNVEF